MLTFLRAQAGEHTRNHLYKPWKISIFKTGNLGMWWAKHGDEDIAHPPDSLKAVELLARYKKQSTFTQSWVPGVLCRVIRRQRYRSNGLLTFPEDL